jgi:hypothetical protein
LGTGEALSFSLCNEPCFIAWHLCSVIIKGEDNEDAVLCTSSRTYGLQRAETSNSLLLVSLEAGPSRAEAGADGSAPRKTLTVQSVMGSHIEVRVLLIALRGASPRRMLECGSAQTMYCECFLCVRCINCRHFPSRLD